MYNEFGKPSLPNLPIHFSLSHCKDAVACAVSDHNIGIDVENIVPYNHDIAQKVCTAAEFEILQQSENNDADFIKLWTMKEAISKFEGFGLSFPFKDIDTNRYILHSRLCDHSKCILSICGLKDDEIKFYKFS